MAEKKQYTVSVNHISDAEKILAKIGMRVTAWSIYFAVGQQNVSFGFRTDLEVEEVVSELSEIGFRPDKIFKDL